MCSSKLFSHYLLFLCHATHSSDFSYHQFANDLEISISIHSSIENSRLLYFILISCPSFNTLTSMHFCARDPMDCTHQPPLSMEFSRSEYWNREPFPSPGDIPNPEIEPRSPALQVDSLPTELSGKPHWG